jgi:hypothetical protein
MTSDLSFDVVKQFALDVWDDLSRTRLAGVAVGLTLALLGITAILLRPSGPPALSSQFATPAPAAEEEVSFSVPDKKPLKLADVKLSAPRDPFRSLGGSESDGSQTLLPAGEQLQDAIMSAGSGAGVSTTGYDEGSSLLPLHDLTTASDPAPVDPAPAPDADEPTSVPVTDYSYAVDVQFGRLDTLERYASVQRLGLLPSRRLPLLMYLGVTSDHETAVFMVDSRLSQGGEGRCLPKPSLCTFLELRATASQDEHHFRDADGNEYLLRLRRLVRTTASAGSLGGRDVSSLEGSPPVVDGTR